MDHLAAGRTDRAVTADHRSETLDSECAAVG